MKLHGLEKLTAGRSRSCSASRRYRSLRHGLWPHEAYPCRLCRTSSPTSADVRQISWLQVTRSCPWARTWQAPWSDARHGLALAPAQCPPSCETLLKQLTRTHAASWTQSASHPRPADLWRKRTPLDLTAVKLTQLLVARHRRLSEKHAVGQPQDNPGPPRWSGSP